jgi:hypothetical protein|nr:MAG TPA: hypothetical protein [Caudoviricetes sp.]
MKIEDYNKYYIQGSDHYLIPKDVFKELFNEMVNWKEESQKQKEVIDKVNKLINHYLKNTDESGSYVETNTRWKLIPEILKELLDILKEV